MALAPLRKQENDHPEAMNTSVLQVHMQLGLD